MVTETKTCGECGGSLCNPDGSYYQIMLDDGVKAKALDVCQLCKLYHVGLKESDGRKVPLAALDNLKRLREKGDGVNYTVASWISIEQTDDELIERRYSVHMDGKIFTRLDRCDLNRTAKSYQTAGWEPYKPKAKIRNCEDALKLVGPALEAKGYAREI